MIGKLSLTEQLADCIVGQPKEVSMLVTPTRNDPGLFEADVEQMVGYEHEKPTEAAKSSTGKKGMAPAVAVVIGGKYK